MVEEIADRDGPAVFGEIREEIRQTVLVAELPVVHEQHDGGGRELLRDRGQTEVGLAVDRAHGLQVRDTAGADVNGAPILHHEDRRSGLALGDEALEKRVDLFRPLVRGVQPAERYQGERQRENREYP